ncbi:ribosomal L7Ae/L30e/S12e/Gadd45 family protein [Paenibacillus thailandensis]|uniref:Ribosomal L7Ae/L30e/S12e/Gadd45 family protein n=1 Tax=Paenibacillus thailandensis TaxID=393250 RepID=A0ABW5R2C6_9BACL
MRFKVGAKQTTKMLEQGRAVEVYIARDADPRMRDKIAQLCERTAIPIKWVDSMKQLGELCGIDVGAATAAAVNVEE